MAAKPKHIEVYDRLRQDIDRGSFGPGDRMPSETQLVSRFGVSRPTISRALGMLEQEGQLIRRRGAGTFVRPRNEGGSELLGLLIPRLHAAGIGGPLAAGIAERAESLQHGLLLAGATPDGDEESDTWAARCCDQFIRHRVRGVFFVPLERHVAQSRANRQIVRRLSAAGLAVVLLDRDVTAYPQRSDYDLVAIDNRRAGAALARHLCERGARRIAFVADHLESSSALERVEGCRLGLLAPGHELPDDRVIKWHPELGAPPLLELLQRGRADACVFVNDLLAREAISIFQQHGIAVPDHLRVAAFDDLPFAGSLSVPLTTIRQPFGQLGMNAVDMLLSRIQSPQQPPRDLRLAGKLVVRRSCGPAPGAAEHAEHA